MAVPKKTPKKTPAKTPKNTGVVTTKASKKTGGTGKAGSNIASSKKGGESEKRKGLMRGKRMPSKGELNSKNPVVRSAAARKIKRIKGIERGVAARSH